MLEFRALKFHGLRASRLSSWVAALSIAGPTLLGACASSNPADGATTERSLAFDVERSDGLPPAGNRTTLPVATDALAAAQTLELARSLADHSDEVIIGEVLRAQGQSQGPNGEPGIHTLVEMRVEQTLRGDRAATTSFWVHGGELEGRKRVLSGQATYRVGERVGVFLYRSSTGTKWPTEMRRGKWTLVPGGKLRPAVRGLVAVEPALLQSTLGVKQ